MSSQQVQLLYKPDASFYRGFVWYRSAHRKALAIHSFEIAMFAIFIPIDCTVSEVGDKMAWALGIAAADSLISLLIVLYSYCTIFARSSILSYCLLARDVNHATTEPVTSLESIEECTNQAILFFAAGVESAGASEQVINIYSNIAAGQIEQANELRYPHLNWWKKVYSFLALAVMIIVIILLAISSRLNPAEIAILIVFLVLEAYLKVKLLIILTLVALSPLICLVFVFYICCCRPREGTMKLNLRAKPAETDDIVRSGGECSICLMNIKHEEPIYQLPCSDKHIFHEGCLENWSRVKPTCPVCRAELPLTEAEEEPNHNNHQ